MPWVRILTDGAVFSTLVTLLIVASLRANPRIWLNDFPPDLRDAVPPKTAEEKRQSLYWGLPLLALLFGGPLVSCLLLERQQPELSSFPVLLLQAYGVAFMFNLVDLLLIDWLFICTFTPRWLVIPGTEGMAGYRDYGHHFRGFLIGCVASFVFAVPAAALVYLT